MFHTLYETTTIIGGVTLPKVGLVVPVYKNFSGFTEMMHSVDYPVLSIVVPNWLDNLGVSKAWNIGLDKAVRSGCDYALVVNDDILFKAGTIYKMVNTMMWNEHDLVTPVNVGDGEAGSKEEYHEHPDFACFMVRPHQFIQKFGNFDENFTPAYFEDNDMHYRIKLAGGKAVSRSDAGFKHVGSVTQNWEGQQVVTSVMFEANREYYAMKWGGYPGEEKFTEPFNGMMK